jgi:hypothetical protein
LLHAVAPRAGSDFFSLWYLLFICVTGGAAGAGGAATTTSQAVMQAQQSRSSKKINYDALKVHSSAISAVFCFTY